MNPQGDSSPIIESGVHFNDEPAATCSKSRLTYPERQAILGITSGRRLRNMFGNIGMPELLIILTIALLVFGPRKLPEVGKSIGKALREFRRTSDEIKEKIEEEIQAEDFKGIKNEIEQDIKDIKESTKPNFMEDIYKDSDKDDEGKKVT